jgi:hypothetical protein
MSTFFIDLKFVRILGTKLLNFKQKRQDLYTFSHDCEDRSRSKVKERGYLYRMENSLYMKCHHCGESCKFSTFLKRKDSVLYDEYRMELYKERVDSKQPAFKPTPVVKPTVEYDSVLHGLVPLTSLNKKHPAVVYALKRNIPEKHFDRIFFSPKFFKYATRFKQSFAKMPTDYPRLVLPYFDANGRVYAMTARAFGPEEPKYLYVGIDETKDRVYGLWRLDTSKNIYAVEGQIDSLCLDNAIAVGGADYSSPLLKSLQSKMIVVPDNDFVRNKQVADQVLKAIKAGYTVSLFPENFKHKDINDAVKSGYTSAELQGMIEQNAKRGAAAELELIFRRKC